MSTRLTPTQAEQIVASHGFSTYTDPSSGSLMGGIPWGRREEDGSMTLGVDWSPVPLTVSGLQAWLGY